MVKYINKNLEIYESFTPEIDNKNISEYCGF